MFETFRSKIAFSGVATLSIGIALLIFTFASAFSFLSGSLQILTSQDLAQTFGDSLAPLIATSIRIMYLGVMGWIGSLVTIRGVTIIANAPKIDMPENQKPQETQAKTQVPLQNQKPSKPVNVEMSVIPLEEMQEQTPVSQKTK